MNNKLNQKRFIAGANCPSCQDLDSLVLYSQDQSIECVSCGFKQTTEQRELQERSEVKNKKIGDINITRLE